jgi:DNA polymerase-4
VQDRAEFAAIGHDLLDQLIPVRAGVRLLGLTLASLVGDDDGDAPDKQAAQKPVQQDFGF